MPSFRFAIGDRVCHVSALSRRIEPVTVYVPEPEPTRYVILRRYIDEGAAGSEYLYFVRRCTSAGWVEGDLITLAESEVCSEADVIAARTPPPPAPPASGS